MDHLAVFEVLVLSFTLTTGIPINPGPVKVNLDVVYAPVDETTKISLPPTTDTFNYDVFRLKNYGKQEAVREEEGIISKFDTAYSKKQALFPVVPIVDQVKGKKLPENNGNVSWLLGHTVVGGYEIFSNLVNAAFEIPKRAGDKLLKNVNTVLGSIGAQLIG